MKDTKITNCNIAAEIMQPVFKDMDHEEVWVLFLKSGNKPICMEMLAKGSLDMVAIDSRTILRRALLNNAAGIVVFHNHPSDDPTPGREDIAFTAKLHDACEIMGINLIDHIVMTDDSYFSFAGEKRYNMKQSE